MHTIDKDSSPLAPVSFNEESAWREFQSDRDTFFKRGSVVTVPLDRGMTLADRRALIATITARHDIFRTAYDTTGGVVGRHTLVDYPHSVMEADEPGYPVPGRHDSYLMPEDVARMWLTPGPDGTDLLSLDLNEMITDTWSCARLHEEILRLVRDGDRSESNGIGIGYADFAREERERPLSPETAEYWRGQLAGVSGLSGLQPDGPDPSGDTAGERVFVLPDELTAAFREVCRRFRLSSFMAVASIVNMTLAALTHDRDILLTTTGGTRAARWTEVQGNFSNHVVLRTMLGTDPTFTEVAAASRATTLGALRHQPAPYLQLGEILGAPPPRPPIRIHFLANRAHHYAVLDTKPSGAAWVENAAFAAWPLDIGFAEDGHNRIAIWLSYDPRKYTHATVDRVIRSCGQTLREVQASEELTCGALADRLPRE